jgi:hypothetical protein
MAGEGDDDEVSPCVFCQLQLELELPNLEARGLVVRIEETTMWTEGAGNGWPIV